MSSRSATRNSYVVSDATRILFLGYTVRNNDWLRRSTRFYHHSHLCELARIRPSHGFPSAGCEILRQKPRL